MNVSFVDILVGTPGWVWLLFAWLLMAGLGRLKSGVRPRGRLWIVPAFFIAWGLLGLAGRGATDPRTLSRWFMGALAGAALGAATPVVVRVEPSTGRIWEAGSVVPLLRNMAIFWAHFVLQARAAFSPRESAAFLADDLYVSGASAGYFVGWAIRFAFAWRTAPRLDALEVGGAPARS
jgi:hypothetical protein